MGDAAGYPRGAAARGGDVTRLLAEWSHGSKEALDTLLPLVYGELRQMARRYLAQERRDHTLQPTAVVHELFLRLLGERRVDWKSRSHFFAIASRAMRRILVDHARARAAAKRGGGATLVPLQAGAGAQDPRAVDLIALDAALSRLEKLDSAKAGVVEMRFFGGLTIDETAKALGLSASTVKRDWSMARAWLFRELTGAEARE